jgi:hypothetical protein
MIKWYCFSNLVNWGFCVFDIDFQNSPMSKYFAHSFWLFLFDNRESLLQINFVLLGISSHILHFFFQELITFVHVCSCHWKCRCLKLSPHVYNTKGSICGWSLACPKISCTSIAHGKIPFTRGWTFLLDCQYCERLCLAHFKPKLSFVNAYRSTTWRVT